MNYSKRLILFVFGIAFLFNASCSLSEDSPGLTVLTGLNLLENKLEIPPAGQSGISYFWTSVLELVDIHSDSDKFAWAPVYSGKNVGYLLALEGRLAEGQDEANAIRYKGERIYKLASGVYALELEDKLYLASFPTALQAIVQGDGVQLHDSNTLNVDQLLRYWLPNIRSQEISDKGNDVVLRPKDHYSWELEVGTDFWEPDSLFSTKVKPLIKEGDSYFRSAEKSIEDSYQGQEDALVDRCLIWRESSLMLIYDNSAGNFSFDEADIRDRKSVYGMADIFQLNQVWNLKLSENSSYPIDDMYAFEWEGLLLLSPEYKILESVLSHLILEETVLSLSEPWKELGVFSVKDLGSMFSSVFELPTKVLGLLPETGFYTCVLNGAHLDLTYSEKESPVNPILIQHSLKNNQGTVFSFFDQRAKLCFLYQDDNNSLNCIDKNGRDLWRIPLEEKLLRFDCADDIGLLGFKNKLEYLDLNTGLLMDSPPPLALFDADTFGLINYPDRPALEHKIWIKEKDGSLKFLTLDQRTEWQLAPLFDSLDCSISHFGFSDTMDYVLQFCGDSLFGQNINGKHLFDPIPLKQNTWSNFHELKGVGLKRLIYPMNNGRVRIINELGQYFNLIVKADMQGFLLGNMDDGPNPEYIGYSNKGISVSGYKGNTFKVFSTYVSQEKIETVKYASTPRGHYLACFKDGGVEILNEELDLLVAFDCPDFEQAYFYFSDFDSALDLVLLDGDKVLNFILEEL